jgi:restriction endonuclease S subunit
MLNQKKYSCGICKTTPDQISHHKAHIETQKHKDKRELFELKLHKLSDEELMNKYKTTIIDDICNETETILNIKNDTTQSYNDYKDIQDMMAEQHCISNKDALKDKIHELHNFLRNNGAGYGMNALKVFNVIYGLKKIDDKGLNEVVGLNPQCIFPNLLKLANENKDEELAKFILQDVLDAINDSKIKAFLFYEIPRNMKGNVFAHLIKEINNITKIEESCNVLLSGKIYEYFIGRDASAISELGAYFTDRHIVDYIYQKLDPSLNEDGTVSSMIDMFGGSGGFTTGYINFLNKKYPDGIKWETEIRKVSHFDMNEDVIKSAGLEFFCLTGVLPDMENLKYKNSFVDDFTQKYKFPITNPPYGGDSNKKTVAQEKREKIKEYIKNELKNTMMDEGTRIARQKQLKSIEAQEKQDKNEGNKSKVCVGSCSNDIRKFAKKYSLTGNDKESCSLMLLMDILDIGGTAIGVLKEGVFFNKTYKDIRKCLIENYNVREVISVDSDAFENTSTKTSIVIFDNTIEKTSEVKFYDLVVEKYEEDRFVDNNGVIIVSENKGDISRVSDKLISVATREEILDNAICSLNAKDYNKKVIVCGEGYELVRLGDVCECLTTTKHCTNIGKQEGKYKFYNSSQDSKLYVDFCEVKDYSIILGQGGNFNIHIDKNFTASKHVCVIQPNSVNDILLNYLYYIIPELQKSLITNGSTISWLNKTNIRDFKIPIPKSEQKIIEWVEKISKPYDEKNSKQNKIKELEEYVKNKIKDIGENEECEEVELGSLIDSKIIPKFTVNTNELDNNGSYPFYNKVGEPLGYHSKYNYDLDECILITKDGGSGPKIYGDNIALGAVKLIKGKFAATYANFVLKVSKLSNLNYIYYLLKNQKNQIMDLANYSVKLGHIQYDKLIKIKIKIPKNKQLIKDLDPTFDEIEKLQGEVKEAETLYNQLIKELSDEAIPHQTSYQPQQLTEANVETLKNTSITQSVPSVKSTSSTVLSLKDQCRSLGYKGYTKMKKDELIKFIEAGGKR